MFNLNITFVSELCVGFEEGKSRESPARSAHAGRSLKVLTFQKGLPPGWRLLKTGGRVPVAPLKAMIRIQDIRLSTSALVLTKSLGIKKTFSGRGVNWLIPLPPQSSVTVTDNYYDYSMNNKFPSTLVFQTLKANSKFQRIVCGSTQNKHSVVANITSRSTDLF